MAYEHIKRCSVLLMQIKNEREVPIKTTIRYHLALVRIVIIKNFTNNRVWRKVTPPTLLVGMLNRYSYYGKQYGGSLKI